MQVHNCYRSKNDAAPGTKAPTPKPKEIRPRQPQPTSYLPDTVEDAAKNAAYKVAVADNKESVAAEAGKESDRINKMAEDAEMLLKAAEDIFDRCKNNLDVCLQYFSPSLTNYCVLLVIPSIVTLIFYYSLGTWQVPVVKL